MNHSDDNKNLAAYVDKFKVEGSEAYSHLDAADREAMLADYEKVIVEIHDHLRESHADLTTTCQDSDISVAVWTSAKAALIAQHADTKLEAACAALALAQMDQEASRVAVMQTLFGSMFGPQDPDSDQGLRDATEGATKN